MNAHRPKQRWSRIAYLLLSIANCVIAGWLFNGYRWPMSGPSEQALLVALVFFGALGLAYFAAFMVSMLRSRLGDVPGGSDPVLPWLDHVRAFMRSFPGRLATTTLAVAVLTVALLAGGTLGFLEIRIDDALAHIALRPRDELRKMIMANWSNIEQQTPAIVVTVETPSPDPVVYLESALSIARELKSLDVAAVVIDTRAFHWSDRERALLALLDSTCKVFWATDRLQPDQRTGYMTLRWVDRGSRGSLPRIFPVWNPTPGVPAGADLAAKLNANGRINPNPLPEIRNGVADIDGIWLPLMSDGSVILRDPFEGSFLTHLTVSADEEGGKPRLRTMTPQRPLPFAGVALRGAYGIGSLRGKVALLGWWPRTQGFPEEWLGYASALRAMKMLSFVRMVSWAFWPFLIVGLFLIYSVCLMFRPFLAMQLSFVVVIAVAAALAWLYIQHLLILGGSYVLLALMLATIILPFQAAREEAKRLESEGDDEASR